MKKNTEHKSQNLFIKEWNCAEINVSIPAKITNSNKPFIYFYWPNSKGEKLSGQEKVASWLGLGDGSFETPWKRNRQVFH